jgi:plasmid stabilization system protein ParE
MEIVWLRRARADLLSIREFIEIDNPSAARATTANIVLTASLLVDQPSLGRSGRVPRTRELVVPGTPYIVAYAVISDHIRVLAVLHGARRWPRSFAREI